MGDGLSADGRRSARHDGAAQLLQPVRLSSLGKVNTAPWREAVIPSTNGHGNARAIAALYDAHLRGEVAGAGREGRLRIAGAALRAEAVKIVSDGLDRVLSRPSRLGLGFQPPRPTRPIGPSPDAYGHFGYGGSLAWPTPRTQRLLAAVYACL